MDIMDTFTVQVGLDEAFKFSDYMEPNTFIIILAILITIFIIFIVKFITRGEFSFDDVISPFGLVMLAFYAVGIAWPLFTVFNENPKIPYEDRLTSDIISKAHDDYLAKEIARKVESEGWMTDCSQSADSILCGGERLGTLVPARKDNGERTRIAVSFSYQYFLHNNGVNMLDVKLGDSIIKPGEPLTVTVELGKIAKESE